MILEPERYIQIIKKLGVDCIYFHASERRRNLHRTISLIKDKSWSSNILWLRYYQMYLKN